MKSPTPDKETAPRTIAICVVLYLSLLLFVALTSDMRPLIFVLEMVAFFVAFLLLTSLDKHIQKRMPNRVIVFIDSLQRSKVFVWLGFIPLLVLYVFLIGSSLKCAGLLPDWLLLLFAPIGFFIMLGGTNRWFAVLLVFFVAAVFSMLCPPVWSDFPFINI